MLVAGCGSSDGDSASLESSQWQVASIASEGGDLTDPLPETTITLRFAQAEVTGNAGCNNYFGQWSTEDDAIQVGPLGSTKRACLPSTDDQESRYLSLLQNAARFETDGSQLTLRNDAGEATLVYDAVEPAQLASTSWEAIAVNDGAEAVVGLVTGTTITAEFGEDGNLAGNGGCNDYSATYVVSGDTISISPPASTRKLCPDPPGVSEQESAYFAALSNSTTWTIDGDRLQLRDQTGALQVDYGPPQG